MYTIIHNYVTTAGAFILLALTPFVFGEWAIDTYFLSMSFMIATITSAYYYFSIKHINRENFIKTYFFFSLGIRFGAVLLYYFLFYNVTGTPFEVTFADSLFYDRVGQEVAEQLRKGDFNLGWMLDAYRSSDKIGYQIFLGIIYSISNNSVIAARLVQATIGAYTVIVAYQIGKIVWNELIGRYIAILFSGFPPFIIYSTLHLREILLVFNYLLIVLAFTKLIESYSSKRLFLLFVSVTCMLFFRSLFVFVFIVSVIVYISIFERGKFRKIVVTVMLFVLYAKILTGLYIFEDSLTKILGYAGLEEDVRLGGYSQEIVIARGMSLAQYIQGPIYVIPSIAFPMPSILKLNIENYGQSMHWYFTGGLIIWVFYSIFFFTEIYKSLKAKNKYAVFLILNILIYSVALLESFYFTSIRFNQVKIALLIFFIPSGMVVLKNRIIYYLIYIIIMIGIVFAYNYLRLAGRGFYVV